MKQAIALVMLCAVLTADVAAASIRSTPTVSLDCLGKPTVKPSEVVLACADAGLGVRHIRWRSAVRDRPTWPACQRDGRVSV